MLDKSGLRLFQHVPMMCIYIRNLLYLSYNFTFFYEKHMKHIKYDDDGDDDDDSEIVDYDDEGHANNHDEKSSSE